MIKVIVDISNATEKEIEELNKLIPFGKDKMLFDNSNIKVNFITKEDIELAKANNTNIESGLYKNVTLGCTSREDADLLLNSHKE